MRQIVIDTETTGLELEKGHRIIEIGCIELINRKITENRFHSYINPQRSTDSEALSVHGITDNFLADKPVFGSIMEDLLKFISDSELIAHNASFDIGFIKYEIKLVTSKNHILDNKVTDTLALARKKFPAQRNTLDSLCKRYGIDLEERKAKGHSALLDAELLARVYLSMTGGQNTLFDDCEDVIINADLENKFGRNKSNGISPLVIRADSNELSTHQQFLENIKKVSNLSLWEKHQ